MELQGEEIVANVKHLSKQTEERSEAFYKLNCSDTYLGFPRMRRTR